MSVILCKNHFKEYYLKAGSREIQDENGGPYTGRKGPQKTRVRSG